jgi:hypothetical protein
MSAADSMRQTTMTQAYSLPGPVPAATIHPTPLPAHISSVPPGYHYFENNGNSYFLNLSTTEKVDLGPVRKKLCMTSASAPLDLEATSDSFVTPSAKKPRARSIGSGTSGSGSDIDAKYVYVRKNKRSKQSEPVELAPDDETLTSGSASETVYPRQLRPSQEYKRSQDLLEMNSDSSYDSGRV